MEEGAVIEFGNGGRRPIIPGARVDQLRTSRGGLQSSTALVDEPLIVDNELDITERFVRVIETKDNNRIVTVIQFASPANKISPAGRAKYRRKRLELIDGGVSVVEVDLIPAGEWNLMAPRHLGEFERPGVYHACLTRAWDFGRSGVYSITLRQRLPSIRIPLRQSDDDVALDLQSLVSQVYENGSYGHLIDYSKPLVPPLPQDDQRWTSEYLKAQLQ
jgi:hypothetical protein